MSFILDALKKSENERQQNTPTEFAGVPASAEAPRAPRWLWVLAGLLLLNAVVLAVLGLRPDSPFSGAPPEGPPRPVAASAPSPAAPAKADTAFSERLEAVRHRQQSTPAKIPTKAAPVPDIATEPQAAPESPASNYALLPSLAELRLDGAVDLPDLHVDIHVFSKRASDRFVFINMNKYRENDRLAEGPSLEEITRDGVILDYRGTRFVLPRE